MKLKSHLYQDLRQTASPKRVVFVLRGKSLRKLLILLSACY